MPCTLCGTDGHNRRTCQRWDLLEAIRHEEAPQLNVEPRPPLLATDVVTRIFQNLADIATDLSIIPTTPTRRALPRVPNAPFRITNNRNQDTLNASFDSGFDDNTDTHANLDDLFSDIDSLSDLDDLLTNLKPNAHSTRLVDCVAEPCKADDCPICMEDFHNTDLFITRCGHQFHGTCMIRHMKLHDNCPMCRGVLFTNLNT